MGLLAKALTQQVMVLTTLVLALLASQVRASLSPGLTCPNPDFAALMVRINYLEIEVRSCKDLVNGIENLDELTETLEAIEGLKTLPADLAGSITTLTGRVDGVESKVNSLETRVDGLRADLTAQTEASNAADTTLQGNIDTLSGTVDGLSQQIIGLQGVDTALSEQITTLEGNVNTLTTTVSEQAATSQSEDAKLQSNIDGVQAACDAKIAEIQNSLTAEIAQREADVADIRAKSLFIFGEWGEWSSCDVTCDLGMKSRTRPCGGNDCASTEGKGNTDFAVCDTEVLCPSIDSGKLLLVGGYMEGNSGQKVPSEIVDIRDGKTCTSPSFMTDYRDGAYSALLYNKYAIVMGGDAIKEEIHVFKDDGTILDVEVEGEGKSRKYAAAVTLADKKSMYVVGGYYSAEGEITDSTEIIHMNSEGTEATGKSGPKIPKKLVNHCFTAFTMNNERYFFLFGGSQTVSLPSSDQASGFSQNGWVLKESDMDVDDSTSWNKATETPTTNVPTNMVYITCATFKTADNKEHIMIVGDEDVMTMTKTLIYKPETNEFTSGPGFKIDQDGLDVYGWFWASMHVSTQVANEVVITGGQGYIMEADFDPFISVDYSQYKFKLQCANGVTDTSARA